MKKSALVPAAISSLRIAALPIFLLLFSSGAIAWCFVLIGLAALTDLLDGYLARKLRVATRFGAYFDAATDFILIIGVYSIFTASGYYPIWLPLLIIASFAQFLLSSLYAKKIYDPIGRYIGSALYIGIVLTLAFPVEAMFLFVQVSFVGFFLVSLASRIVSLKKTGAKP
jgi:phosphatidylglycerophosphate synthase